MAEFQGKTAVISGGAEGIGFSIARAMGAQGMNIVLGDIDPVQLEKAVATLTAQDVPVLGVVMDVTQPAQWQALARQASERFGNIHMLVNNAGVGGGTGTVEQISERDWRWVLDVNLMGVIYGTQTVVPLIKQHGEGGWLINVASMAGMVGVPYAGAYTATKVAVVGMSESWFAELQPHHIKVSVLCPAFVQTRINLSERNRQAGYQHAEDATEQDAAIAARMQAIIDNGLAVDVVGERVVEAVRQGELYIFTHPNYRKVVQQRYQAIDDAFARAADSPLLASVLDEDIVGFT
ncbi:SDR family NAD(P)-dependent oxidoreductase [Pseudohongiella sp.]|uniref:Oxidoreductase n=1 Tax=marine sediment metagenome TaxID=412755 RepID=A0A0F9VPI9_9ZZZZ|nr:SDR family NAD(P)-dependent oxidoreductase [Pseudohongiella sp.]HDZ10240.1 SDR family NAD(P)-dependent oxidoreductase [Pseudohongiella sp.]HEA64220.1 SDR family NAD(P)-dependent oxidoreductase [Pseudohongiella sp.]